RRPRTLCALRTRTQQISTSCSLVRHVFALESSNKCATWKKSRVNCYFAIVGTVYFQLRFCQHCSLSARKKSAHHRNKNCPKYRTEFRMHGGRSCHKAEDVYVLNRCLLRTSLGFPSTPTLSTSSKCF